jgi:2-dehydro-3-deoxygalactonokinase
MHKTFLSCDWGNSSFRLRLIDIVSGQIIAESSDGEGIGAVYALWKNPAKDEKERIPFYLSVIQNHIKKIEQHTGNSTGNIPVILSGMASSTIGMLALPYTVLPFSLSGEDLQYKRIEKTASFVHDLVIISGARTATDVMRGEEIQLIGCAAEALDARKIFIFTGTHSKHITISLGKATDTATYMTGEFFELLANKSILSDSVAAGAALEDKENKPAFEQGVKESMQQNLLHNSFMVRTNQLFKRYSKEANYFYLSGLLIGSELGQLAEREMDEITIVGDKKLVTNYLLALKVLGINCKVTTVDAMQATIKGQLVLFKQVYQ